jgi:DNA-binding SARP family transcriptional activator
MRECSRPIPGNLRITARTKRERNPFSDSRFATIDLQHWPSERAMGGTQVTEPVTVRVLGPVTIHGPNGTVTVRGRQPAAVAAFVALNRRPVTRDELAELLWGENLSDHWPSALRGVLSKVRSSFTRAGFPASTVRSDDTIVRVDIPDLRTDLDLTEQLTECEGATDGELTAAAHALGRPFLPHDDSEWGRTVRDRIRTAARRVTMRHVGLLRHDGRVDQAVSILRSAIAADPLDEAAHHALIETLLAADRRVDAGEAFEELTIALDREFGIAPAAATAQLLHRADGAHRAVAAPRSRAVIHPHSDEPFVGRQSELDTLRQIWDDVVGTRRPQLAIIEGPAGIGKTRLADRFYDVHVRDDTAVIWGRNRDGSDQAFGALAEAIQRLIDDHPEVIDRLGDRARGLWPLLPRFTSGDITRDPLSIRELMVDALRAVLVELSRGPTIWFVDDLQWASPDAVSIMESVVDDLRVPVLMLVTARSMPRDVAARLGSLQRVLPTTSIKLPPMSPDDIADLLDDREIAERIHERTGGLAFFASEIARQATRVDGGIDACAIPDTITDWVSRRVQSLAPPEAAVVQLASVIGHEVDPHLLERCASSGEADIAESIDELVRLGLLTFDRSDSLQFAHVITRDAIYDAIGTATRMRLHREVADAAAGLARDGDEPDHALLAHHYGLAGADAAVLAWTHRMNAARWAMRYGAWASAASLYTDAIGIATSRRQRGRAIVGAGRAHLAQGELERARVLLYEAVELSEEHDHPAIQAEATLSLVGRAGRGAIGDTDPGEQERLLRSALSALERDVDPTPRTMELWADLERELAIVLLLSGSADERSVLLHRSLARARSIEPARPQAVARALLGMRYAKLDPTLLTSRISDAREVLAMPAREIGSEIRLSAYCYLHEDLRRLGKWDEADRVLAQAERLADRYPHSYWTWAIRTWRALAFADAGDLAAAEAGAAAAAAMRPGIAEADACLLVNLTNIRLQQGRAGEMLPMLAPAVAAYPEVPLYRAVLALCAAEAGDGTRASDLLATFADDGFANLPDDTNRFMGLVALAHVAADLGDLAACELLRPLLEPYRDHWVVLQCYGGGGGTWGPTTHALARIAAIRGDLDAARDLYDEALAMAAHSPFATARINRHQTPFV